MSSHVVMSCRQCVNTQGWCRPSKFMMIIYQAAGLPTFHPLLLGHDITRKGFFVRHRPLCAFRLPIESPSPLTHTHTYTHTLTPSHSQEGSHWVSFHFQKSRDELVWVTVTGKAAIFLALCLHSAVDELLRQRSNKPIRKPSENVSKGQTQ